MTFPSDFKESNGLDCGGLCFTEEHDETNSQHLDFWIHKAGIKSINIWLTKVSHLKLN